MQNRHIPRNLDLNITGDVAHNPGICPDWELNWQPFGSQAYAQSTELHQPGILHKILNDPPSSTILNILGYSGYLYIILT